MEKLQRLVRKYVPPSDRVAKALMGKSLPLTGNAEGEEIVSSLYESIGSSLII